MAGATRIDGKKVAVSVIEAVKAATSALEDEAGVKTGLAVVIVGDDPASQVASLNADPSVHGILVQLPLQKHLDADAIIQSIRPEKDVDGLHVVNAAQLATVISPPGRRLSSC